MIQKLFRAAAIASVAIAGLATIPASAQNYYGQDRYYQSSDHDNRYDDDRGYQDNRYDDDRGYQDNRYENDRRQEQYRRYQIQQRRIQYDRWQRAQHNQAYAARGYGQDFGYQNGYGEPAYGQQRRCSSGTTGAVVGAVLGGLLGREVGRGGRFNDPSTTGAIIGAGGGALAGRAIERNRNCR